MDAVRYRIVLTGELKEGHQLDAVVGSLVNLFHQPAEKLRLVVNGRRPFPLKQEFELDKAKRVCERILAAGADCRLEPVGAAQPPSGFQVTTAPVPPQVAPAGHLTCPKCGRVQPESDTCTACGIVFAKYRARADEAEAEAAAPPFSPRELEYAFIGPKADLYEDRFARFRSAGGYAFSWHWPALFGPFFWALYRKLWMWAAVMFLSGIFWPLSNLVWAATAHYLYFRHVRTELETYEARPGRKDPEALLADGGVSRAAVGIAAGLFLAGAIAFAVMVGSVVSLIQSTSSGEGISADPAVLASAESQQTVVRLNAIALSVEFLRMGGTDVEGMDMAALQQQLQFPDENVADSWGSRLELSVRTDEFTVTSAGPDLTFDTGDDIAVTRPLR